jgi:hypothetical protein
MGTLNIMTYPSQEQSFILGYAKNAAKGNQNNIMKSYVDSTGQVARVTTSCEISRLETWRKLKPNFGPKSTKYFPDRYKVCYDGKALVFEKEQNTCW